MKIKKVLLNIFPNVLIDIIMSYYKYPVRLKINKSIEFHFDIKLYIGHVHNLIFMISRHNWLDYKKKMICYNLLTNQYKKINQKLINIFSRESIDRIHCYKDIIYVYTQEDNIYKLDMTYNIIKCHKLDYKKSSFDYNFFSKHYFIWRSPGGIINIHNINDNKFVRKFPINEYCSGLIIKNIQIYKNTIFSVDDSIRCDCDSLVMYSLNSPHRQYDIMEISYHVRFLIVNNYIYVAEYTGLDNGYFMTIYDLTNKKKYTYDIAFNSLPELIIKVDYQLFVLCSNKIYILDLY